MQFVNPHALARVTDDEALPGWVVWRDSENLLVVYDMTFQETPVSSGN